MAVTFAQVLLPGRAVSLSFVASLWLVASQLLPSLNISHMSTPLTFIFVSMQRAYSIRVVVVRHMAVQGRLTPQTLTISCVSIYRLISMYNGSDSNTSAHTRFAKPLETRRTSHYPETYSIIHYLSPTWSAKPWNLSLTVSSRGNTQPTSS